MRRCWIGRGSFTAMSASASRLSLHRIGLALRAEGEVRDRMRELHDGTDGLAADVCEAAQAALFHYLQTASMTALGTLWEDRYHSVLVEDSAAALRTVGGLHRSERGARGGGGGPEGLPVERLRGGGGEPGRGKRPTRCSCTWRANMRRPWSKWRRRIGGICMWSGGRVGEGEGA